MGTTADKLNKLITTKEDIRQAIISKGVSVGTSDTFASYSNKIRQIQGGSGNVLRTSPYFFDMLASEEAKVANGLSYTTIYPWKDSRDGTTLTAFKLYCLYDGYNKVKDLVECDKSILTYVRGFDLFTEGLSDIISDNSTKWIALAKQLFHNDSNDLSGPNGYWNLDNCRKIDFLYIEYMLRYKDVIGYQDYNYLIAPKIYAPLCANMRYILYNKNTKNNSYFLNDNGIFYTPNGQPYEITPEALNYDGVLANDIYGGTGSNKKVNLDIRFRISDLSILDDILNTFPINNTGVSGSCAIVVYHQIDESTQETITLTEKQNDIIRNKNWTR